MEVSAKLRYARISPKKCRIVADQIRGKPVAEALDILRFSPKRAAHLIRKVLESAIANAEHNAGLDVDDLYVSAIYVDDGPRMKRILPRARGRADVMLKRMSHITVKVAERS